MDFKFYFSLFLRRLHWFMLFFIVCSAIGLTLAKVLPPVYVAQARLLVESEQIPGNLAESTVRIEATEQLQIIQQRILTRDTLIDMANRLNIYETQPGQTRPRMDADAIVKDMRNRIEFNTSGGTRRGVVSATLVTVGFEAPSARTASTVANELVTLILREDVGMRTRVARQTLEFFEQEVDRLDTVLATQGAAILSFKEGNLDALPDSLEFRRSQQAANQERLLQLERGETAILDRRARLVRLHEVFGDQASTTDQSGTNEQAQLQKLKDELASQLSILSPENPRIKLLNARIAAVQAIVDKQLEARNLAQEGAPMTAHEAQLAELDGQLEFIADQKKQVSDALEGLRVSIEATPGNAITLETLERDYENSRTQYDQAVANKARAQTGEIIESLRQGQRISVVEQAVVPSEPEKPNRKLIAAGGVGAGVFVGLAVVVLMELLNKGIRRPVDLTSRLGITPFVTLPYYRTKAEMVRRRMIIFGILGFCIIAIPAGLWAIDTFVISIDRLITGIVQGIGLAELDTVSTPVQA